MITFQDKQFGTRLVDLPEFGEVLVSVTSLNEILLKEDDHVSNEAMEIDEQIFYFVEDEQINLPYDELRDLLIAEVR